MQRFFVYKIYYGNELVYIGRTKQELINRMRAHMTKELDAVLIDPDLVTKIEYASCNTEADMCLYELYYINTFHPRLNTDSNTKDNLTVYLPDLNFTEFYFKPQLNKWKKAKREKEEKQLIKNQQLNQSNRLINSYKEKLDLGLITREDYELLVKQANNLFHY